MERLLLLMPKFMGYEKTLKENLQKKYDVTWVDCDQFDKEVLSYYKKCGKLRWGVRNISSKFREYDQEKAESLFLQQELNQVSLKKDYYSVIFCINGSFLADAFYYTIKTQNPNAKFIYYAWDDVKNLVKQSHIKYFDKVYAYNIQECKEYSWTYLPMFVQSEKIGHAERNEYDIMFIGTAHSDRQNIADKLFDKYSGQYKIFIYLYDPQHTNGRFCYDKPLSYEKYLDTMRKSRVIVDVPQITQVGPTTRSLDALLAETKVMTTNVHIKEYPIYSANILIVDRNNIVIDDEFIKKPYQKNGYEPLTIQKWIMEIGL